MTWSLNNVLITTYSLERFIKKKTIKMLKKKLVTHFPNDKIIVSESGISTREHINTVSKCGVSAVLVGEALVTSENIASSVKILTEQNDLHR